MLVEIYIFFQIVVIGLFLASFFTKQEILWVLTLVLSGVLMFTSFHVESYVYQVNVTLGAYEAIQVSHSYPYLMGINLLFFVLSMVLGLFDLFDKYGGEVSEKFSKFKK